MLSTSVLPKWSNRYRRSSANVASKASLRSSSVLTVVGKCSCLLAASDIIDNAVLRMLSSKNSKPMLNCVCCSVAHTTSRKNCDLPSPLPAVTVTSSAGRIPYVKALMPLKGYTTSAVSIGVLTSSHKDAALTMPSGTYFSAFQKASLNS